MSNDGSQANPWSTLEAVFSSNKIESQKPATYPYVEDAPLVPRNPGAPVKAGDTILLLSGDHGTVSLGGWYNASMITIEAAPGATPVIRRWTLEGGKFWTLRGITVSPEPYGTVAKGTLVKFASHSHQGPISDITVEDCHCYTVDDSSAWTATDWNNLASDGITVGGKRGVIRNNVVRNVNWGILPGSYSLVEYNDIINFAGDGMRCNGNYTTIQYNLIKNCYKVNSNHDDGIQSFSTGPGGSGSGTVYGNVIRGNVILQNDGSVGALNGTLQGIGCFDGFYEDWVVENNVIVVDQYHGLSFYGAINCKIANNTVVERVAGANTPWIRVGDHKTRGPGSGNTIINNIAPSYQLGSNAGGTSSNNLSVAFASYASYFNDAPGFDFYPIAGSPLIDQGTAIGAPELDIDGTIRPQGSAHDVGAYEFIAQIDVAGNGSDREALSNGGLRTVNYPTARIGGNGGAGVDAAMIYVFQLPALPTGQRVHDANFAFSLIGRSYYSPGCNADVYGLPFRASSSVVGGDFYQGAYGGDANATPIEDNIMVATQPSGRITTSATGKTNLADYLTAQYAAGAQAGSYIFVRVNPDGNAPDGRYWTVATANNETTGNRPVLSIQFGPEL